jgi:hypothetical protein
MNLSIFEYHSTNIRFENRDGRIWVCLTDMAKASSKLVADWARLKATKEYLQTLESVMQIPITETVQGGKPTKQGTWAIEEVAIEFAGWCNVQFKIWVNQQIKTLMKEGSVSLKPKTALELAKEQVKLLEKLELQEKIIEGLEEDNERQAEVIDELFQYSSIIRIAKFNNCSEKAFNWRKLKAASQVMEKEVKRVPCPRFGTKNLYSHDVWRYVYPQYQLPETTIIRIKPKS